MGAKHICLDKHIPKPSGQIYRFADSTVYVDKIKKKDYQTNFIYYEVEE